MDEQTFASPISESFKRSQVLGSHTSPPQSPKPACDPDQLYLVTRKLRNLAKELSAQEEIGLNEETLLKIFESKAEQLACFGTFSFD